MDPISPSGPVGSGGKAAQSPNPSVEQDLAVVARSLCLGALISAALPACIALAVESRWPAEYLTQNLAYPGERARLLAWMASAAVVGAAAALGALLWARKRSASLLVVERWLWFVSPLSLLPTLPVLWRHGAWQDNHETFLPLLLAVGLLLEVLLCRALSCIPPEASAVWHAVSAKVPVLARRHGPLLVVVVAAVAYAVFMSFFTIRWHHKLGTGNYDLGINNNLMYGGLHGDFNQSAIVFPHNPAQYVANHVKLGLYAFLPIYALVPRPETLQVIQSAMLGLGAVPLFLFARRWLHQGMAALIALCWLCYYPLHSANFYEVKEAPIGSFFVLTVAWAVEARRWVIMGIAFVIGMLIREDMPVGFAVMGGFLLLSGHRPRVGAAMALVASSWFVLLRFHVMQEAGEWWFPNMYADLWAPGERGFTSVVKTLVSNPFFTLGHVLVEAKIYYLLHLLVPLLFLPARRWYLWASFLPGALLTLLVTDYKPVTMFSFHYVMNWAPYLFLALPLALAHYRASGASDAARTWASTIALVFASAASSYNYGAFCARNGALKSGYHSITFSMSDAERETYAQLRDILSSIPREASVAATEKIGPHASSRRRFYSLRRDSYHADYLIARQKELRLDRTKSVIKKALTGGEYGVYRQVGPFVLMKRGHSTTHNQSIVEAWELR